MTSTLTQTDIDVDGYSLHAGKYIGGSTSLELGWDSTESKSKSALLGCLPYSICGPLGGPSVISETETKEASFRIFHVGEIARLAYSVSGRAASSRTHRNLQVVGPAPPSGYRPPSLLVRRGLDLPPGIVLDDPPRVYIAPGAVVAATVRNPPSLRSQTYEAAVQIFPTARLGVGVGYSHWDGDALDDDAYDVSVDWFFLRNVAAGLRFSRINRVARSAPTLTSYGAA